MVFIDNFTDERFLQKENLKKSADIISIFCTAAFSANVILAFAMGILGLTENYTLYMLSMTAVSVIAILGVSMICAKFGGGMKSCIKKYEKKTGFFDNFLLIVFGFSGCMTVNFILNLIAMFLPIPVGSDIPTAENTDIYTTMLMQLAIAVAPAICEEIAFRGFVMGSLSDFGDGFAILISSMFFGMMHTGLSGIVFAFSVGLLLGFIRKISGSMIPSMIVHFLNNAYSVLMLVCLKILDIEIFGIISGTFVFTMLLVFAVMLIIFCNRKSVLSAFSTGECILTKAEKVKIIFTNPVLWVFVIFSVMTSILSMVGMAE